MTKPNLSIQERFFMKVEKTDTCWNWMAYRKKTGYGCFCMGVKNNLAHRVSWELHNGSIPEGLHVLHKCHNPRCVNPDHLYVGTHTDNMNDRIKDGTSPRGEKHHSAKLTEENVKTAKWLLSCGARPLDLSVMYKVAPHCISNIKTGRTWGHVLLEMPSRKISINCAI